MDKSIIKSAAELVTSREQTRAGFIEAALEKSEKARPYIEQAKTLRALASKIDKPTDLLNFPEIREGLLTASGLSDKSLKYFTEGDRIEAIKLLIKNFLEPAGKNFRDELTYRFLLIKGDSLGGTMCNFVGQVAHMKLVRKLLSVLSIRNITYSILFKNNRNNNNWHNGCYESDYANAATITAIHWHYKNNNRLLFFNAKIPVVNKNIDICLYDGTPDNFKNKAVVNMPQRAIMFGELKGGIDPAGADEHWKTGNSALERIRESFKNYNIYTSFIGAAIEQNMADEIFRQISNNTLSCAINLTVNTQLTNYCNWIIEL